MCCQCGYAPTGRWFRNVSGPIPDGISALSSLQYVELLAYAWVSGKAAGELHPLLPVHGELQPVLYHTPPPMPTGLHALRVLRRVLMINTNYLTGTLPPGLSGLSKLR